MIFQETPLAGAFVIDPERITDGRGYFARTWCVAEFAAHGLSTALVQCNTSFNTQRGTLRGMHFQIDPHPEIKLVRCTRGGIFDVIVDLRPDSPTCHRWVGVELSPENGRLLYIPAGFAHGFQTLHDATEVAYQMSEFFHPESARGVRWNDPKLAITWPLAAVNLSEKDRQYPLL